MRRQVLVCCLRGITPDEPQVHDHNLPARAPGRKKNPREGQEGGAAPNPARFCPNRFSPESLRYAARISKILAQTDRGPVIDASFCAVALCFFVMPISARVGSTWFPFGTKSDLRP